MAWGARQVDGVWRLCERKGRTIDKAIMPDGDVVEIKFKSQAKAKACADVLNAEFWDTFKSLTKKRGRPPEPEGFREQMVSKIQEFMHQ